MKKILYILMSAAMILSSCDNDNPVPPANDPDPQPEQEAPAVLGTYVFDGKSVDILQVRFEESENFIAFTFSPLLKDELTTYVAFELAKSYMGKEYEARRLFHNDDYFFVYEDPIRYYSHYRQLEGGTILVRHNPDGTYTVKLDVLLNDLTPFQLDYTGNPLQ